MKYFKFILFIICGVLSYHSSTFSMAKKQPTQALDEACQYDGQAINNAAESTYQEYENYEYMSWGGCFMTSERNSITNREIPRQITKIENTLRLGPLGTMFYWPSTYTDRNPALAENRIEAENIVSKRLASTMGIESADIGSATFSSSHKEIQKGKEFINEKNVAWPKTIGCTSSIADKTMIMKAKLNCTSKENCLQKSKETSEFLRAYQKFSCHSILSCVSGSNPSVDVPNALHWAQFYDCGWAQADINELVKKHSPTTSNSAEASSTKAVKRDPANTNAIDEQKVQSKAAE